MKYRENFFFDPTLLEARAKNFRASYALADPFPHIIIDNFLPEEVAEAALEEFPLQEAIQWKNKTHDHSNRKLTCNNETMLPPFLRNLFLQFNSATFTLFLEEISGIPTLIPDPYLEGGGLHQILPGGFLDVHADFNRHEVLGLDRRLNLLLYLNKDWQDAYGGHLELWDSAMQRCIKKVAPLFNRCVIFSTTDYSFHGHPYPLACPRGMTRKSLALYYYTNGRPEKEQSSAHSTLYQTVPGARIRLSRNTIIKKFLPPIIVDVVSAVRKRMRRSNTVVKML